MKQLTAALTGRYAIEREIGAGGMATVYLARDLRHNRRVALKVLNAELGAVLGKERFLAEIETTANLQHPHLLPLFDSGEADGLLFYVMPYVEGESLRARLQRERQLPVEEAVRIATAVASALDYAHRHDVIHRDLKPENILLHDGQPLVADFGIALAVSKAGGARITQTGLSLGTPQYMSPEQATGDRVLDARTDIYSLGCVLYEMLTGDPPHTASTSQAIIARVLTETPRPMRATRPNVPAHVEAAVLKSLEKLPADRFSSAHAFADALARPGLLDAAAATGVPHSTGVMTGATEPAGPARTLRRARVVAAGLGVIAVAASAVALVLWSGRGTPQDVPPLVRFGLAGTADMRLGTKPVAISADGRTIAWSRRDGGGIWVRTLDEPQARRLEGTAYGLWPDFSPDGEWIAFVVYPTDGTERRIMKIATAGGPPTVVTPFPDFGTVGWVSWASNAEILFEQVQLGRGHTWIVSANGGAPRVAIPLDTAAGEVQHRRPFPLRDLRMVVYASTDRSDRTELAIASLEDGRRARLGIEGVQALGIVDGRLVYAREDGSLMAVPFDGRAMRVTGEPTRLPERAASGVPGVFAALSPSGTLVHKTGPTAWQLVLVDTAGRSTPVADVLRDFETPRFSPDGRHIAVSVAGAAGPDIWVYERAGSGRGSRITTTANVSGFEWTPDGKRLLYVARSAEGADELWSVPIDRGAEPERFDAAGGAVRAAAMLPDGSGLVVHRFDAAGLPEVVLIPLAGGAAPTTILPAAARPLQALPSPDGRWLAYLEQRDVISTWIRALDTGDRVRLTGGTGGQFRWAADSRRLYSRELTMFRTEIEQSPTLAVAGVHELAALSLQSFRSVPRLNAAPSFDVDPLGNGFVFVSDPAEAETEILVSVNWAANVARQWRER